MMTTNQRITSSGSSQESKYAEIADMVFSSVNKHLMILINQMLNSADKKLFDLAEKATSNEDRMKFMDCTRIFRTDKNDIRHHFFLNLNNSLTSLKENLTVDENGELSLVDQDEMEEMVAITTMHAQAMNSFGDEVNNLEARLEYLELMSEKSIVKESLDPKHICEVFQKTIENIDMDIEVKLVFYKLFDQEVCSKLGVMYKTANQIFIGHGVLPEIILKTMKQADVENDGDEISTQVASYYDPKNNVATDFIPRTNNDFARIVNEFMTGEMTITGEELQLPDSFLRAPTQRDLNGKNCYERKEVVKALSSLQRKITSLHEGKENLTAEQIKQELVADISNEHGGIVDKQVNLLDERSIDFVGMMFSAIADDADVSEIMTNLIYHLQIPVMKIAMIDRSLFDSQPHPARVTVDLLTTAGMGINAKDDHLYYELEQIVDNVLEKFDIDLATFEKAVEDLGSIIKKEEQLTAETERQQQKKILQEHARSIVITQLKMVSFEKQIPDKVRPLVLKHWSTLMLNRYIRYGRNSEPWLQAVMLLKLLLKCIQPVKFPSQYDLLKKNSEALIEALDDELSQTQQDKSHVNEQMIELSAHFSQLIAGYGPKLVSASDAKVEKEALRVAVLDNTDDELQRVRQQTKIAREKIAQLPISTRPGVWYEIYNGKNKPVRRLKLSVILTDAAQLIFVDRKGVRVISKAAEEFVKELEDNRSRILADHSAFDQALGKVITALAA